MLAQIKRTEKGNAQGVNISLQQIYLMLMASLGCTESIIISDVAGSGIGFSLLTIGIISNKVAVFLDREVNIGRPDVIMRDASTMQITQPIHQIPQEAMELLNAPIPIIRPSVLDDLR